jgi:hypothetical protein
MAASKGFFSSMKSVSWSEQVSERLATKSPRVGSTFKGRSLCTRLESERACESAHICRRP